ncbi:MAG: gliding motility-associated C-terminal domain-containing protein [Saprospiraceae bacterium]|nr:gliding motility-associated C-terminal domain-containing protein [Saprospiraceae bacterium]
MPRFRFIAAPAIFCLSIVMSLNAAPDRSRSGPETDSTATHTTPLPPGAVIVSNAPPLLCTGGPVSFQVYVSGCNGPYTITYSINTVLQPPVTALSSPYDFTLVINSTTTVNLVSVTSPGCFIVPLSYVTVFVDPPLTATLSGGGTTCGDSIGADLTVSFTGNGPYTFTYRANGILQPAITTTTNPYILNVSPSVNTTYQLVNIFNNNCSGTVSNNQANVTLIDPPEATLAGDLTFCRLADTTLPVQLVGAGPFELIYAIDSILQPPIQTSNNPYLLPVYTDSTSVYSLVSVQSPGCIGTATGDATITILGHPQDTNLMILCIPEDETYVVEFDIENATPPITFTAGAGNLTGTHFTSDPIHQSLGYQFAFFDSNGCDTIEVAGPSICFCVSDAGVMATADTLHACIGDTATAVFLGGEALDGDDALLFVLHTAPGDSLGQILAWASVPDFVFLPGMQPGAVYYISSVAGDVVGTDSIDLADNCLSASPGTPVIFHNLPAATLGPDTTICTALTAIIPVTFTGTQPFAFTYAINGVAQPGVQGINSGSYDISLTPAASSVLNLIQVSDQYCGSPAGDSALISVNDIPQIANLNYACDLPTSSYTVQFSITGGAAPYSISGTGGSLNGTQFTGDPIQSGQPYSFTLSDVNNCGVSIVSGLESCPCYTNAGAMDPDTIKLCPGDTAHAVHNAAQLLDNTDALVFVLHSGPAPGPGNILATSNAPDFGFDPAQMQFGVTYLISPVAGNMLPGGGVDFTDTCLAVGPGTPVVWNAAPTAALTGNYDVCPGQPVMLDVLFTGQAPYHFGFLESGVQDSILAFTDAFLLSLVPAGSGVVTPVFVTDAYCPGTVSGQAAVIVHPVPEIVNPAYTCDPDNLHYMVSFAVQQGDLSTAVVSSLLAGNFDPAGGLFTSAAANLPDVYTFYVSDGWQCGQDTLEIVPDCPCITDAGHIGLTPIDICVGEAIGFSAAAGQVLDLFDAAEYVLCTDPAGLPQSVLFHSTSPQFAYSPLLQPDSTYFIVAIAGNPLPGGDLNYDDPCLSTSLPLPVHVHGLPTASISGDTLLCSGSAFDFPVTLTGAPPFQFSYTRNGLLQNPVNTGQFTYDISLPNVQQPEIFTLLSVQDKYCSGTAGGQVNIDVQPIPVLELSGASRICPGDSAMLSLSLQHALAVDFDLFASTGVLQSFTGLGDGAVLWVLPAQTTTYFLQNVQVYGNFCPIETQGTGMVELAPLEVAATAGDYSGFGVSCFGAADGSASATYSGGFSPVNLLWNTNENTPSISGLPPGAYSVTATDSEGCADAADLEISEPAPLYAGWATGDIDCHPGSAGVLIINALAGGAGVYTIQVDNQPAVPLAGLPQSIGGLPAGVFTFTLADANGCVFDGADTIFLPLMPSLDLGSEQTVYPGDSVLLSGIATGNPPVLMIWSPQDGLSTPDSLSTWATPNTSTTYTLLIEDAGGCTATASVIVNVKKSKRVYLPNVIKPGAGQDNGIFTVYAGKEVKRVNYMAIYDRWGEHLFEAKDFLPNDPSAGWDGRWRNRDMQPGVYVYVVELTFQDGETELYTGTVTIVR